MPFRLHGRNSVCQALGVVLNNSSLKYNAVGVFQLLKVMITPCTIGINYGFYGKTCSRQEVAALVLMCIGTIL